MVSGTGAVKEVAAFCWREEIGDAADGLPQALDGALRGFAQQRLVFGESLLDRVQIGAVGRQIDELRPSDGDRLGNAGDFMAAQIIEQDNVAGRQCRRQHLLDIGAKTLPVESTLEHIGYTDPGCSQSGDQGGQLPVTVRDRSPQPQTARTSAIAARHVRGGPSLVDEDQAIGIERRLAANNPAPGLGYIRPLLLGRVQGLFLSVNFWPARNRCTVLSPTVTPHEAASALRISCKVKSGCRATNCSTFARCSPNRERRSPPIARGRAWPSARQR